MQTASSNAAAPLRAGLPTRIVYSVGLVGFLPSALAGSSGWISLALGGGVLGQIGPAAFQVIAALAIFRAYQVLRYPAALNARPPNALGWLLRWLGWLGMLLGAASAVGLFAIKPITLLLFRSAGDAGVGYFVVGLALVAFSNFGLLGCLAFEVSRACGRALPEGAGPPWSRRGQDFAVLGVLLAAAIATPFLYRQAVGRPCGKDDLAACVSTTQGGVRRMIGLPYGEPVVFESTVDEIELRSTSGRKWSLTESPLASLLGAGHPAAESAPSAVRVRVDAKPDGKAVVLELTVHQGEEETARFVTRFPRGATLEPTADGRTRVVVDLPANAQSGMRTMTPDPRTGRYVSYDQLFIQMRSAIGSESEAREWPLRVRRTATLVSASAAGAPATEAPPDAYVDPACNGKLKVAVAKQLAFQGRLGLRMRDITFLTGGGPGPHTLMGPLDRVVCSDDEIWIVSFLARPGLRIRRFSPEGSLMRFVDTALPAAKLGQLEFDRVVAKSLREDGGRILLERVVASFVGGKQMVKKRELFEVTP